MAKKTRTELSTLAINTNLPDNTTELITPTTERAQLTDERESVVNYKDDFGGAGNAGKFLTVAGDGESLTMVDAPTGDVTGTGAQYQLAIWDGTSALTGYAALTYINSILQAPQLRADSSNGTVTINATDASGGTAWLYFQNASVLKAEISYFIQDDFLTIRTYQKDIVFERAVNTPTLTIDGTTGDATFNGALEVSGAATLGTGASSYTFGGGSAAAGDLTDKDLTLKAWSPTSGTNDYSGDLILQSGLPIGNGSGKLGSVIIKTGIGGAASTSVGSYLTSATFSSEGAIISGDYANDPLIKLASSVEVEIRTATVSYNAGIGVVTSGYDFNIFTENTPRLTISSGGLVTVQNGIKFGGTPSPAYDSGATTLDAYEEGTWTPTFNANITTSGTPSGKYTRIGRLIHATCIFGYSALTGSDIAISGLPYNNGSVRESTVNAFSGVGRTTNQFFGVVVEASASTFYVEVLNSASGVSFTATASCWYQV
jgi:hypothetical protein